MVKTIVGAVLSIVVLCSTSTSIALVAARPDSIWSNRIATIGFRLPREWRALSASQMSAFLKMTKRDQPTQTWGLVALGGAMASSKQGRGLIVLAELALAGSDRGVIKSKADRKTVIDAYTKAFIRGHDYNLVVRRQTEVVGGISASCLLANSPNGLSFERYCAAIPATNKSAYLGLAAAPDNVWESFLPAFNTVTRSARFPPLH